MPCKTVDLQLSAKELIYLEAEVDMYLRKDTRPFIEWYEPHETMVKKLLAKIREKRRELFLYEHEKEENDATQ